VEGTPPTPDATQQVLEKLGPIRQTHYGGFYDFIPDLALADTAYTNLALAAHTDTTYFTEPAGLQAFHMLSHTAASGKEEGSGASGGKSLLVDGFNVAAQLRTKNQQHFEMLRDTKLPWHASGNQGIAIAPDRAYPVFETSDDGELQRVRWNNDDRGVVPLECSPEDWYQAARSWNALLTDQTNEFWFQLTPGRLLSLFPLQLLRKLLKLTDDLVFDNWRVLHGRSAFEGVRRMTGGYSE
jgi:trimethyllysine dioxygenase